MREYYCEDKHTEICAQAVGGLIISELPNYALDAGAWCTNTSPPIYNGEKIPAHRGNKMGYI